MGIEAAVLSGAAISGITGLIGGANAAGAADEAAGLRADAAGNALAFRREIFDTSRRDLAPFAQVGLGALDELSRIFLGTSSPAARRNAANGGLSPAPFDSSALEAERGALVQGLNAPGVFTGERENELGNPSFEFERFQQQQLTRDPASATTRIAEIDRLIKEGNTPQDFGTFTPGQLSQEERQANFFTSPNFTFVRDEGERAIDRALAARGLFDSGPALKELTRFNSNLASGEFNNFTNRLSQLAGLGGNAIQTTANLGQNFAAQGGNDILNAGDARASGVVGRANAFSDTLGNLDFTANNLLSRFSAPPGGQVRLPQNTNVFSGIF